MIKYAKYSLKPFTYQNVMKIFIPKIKVSVTKRLKYELKLRWVLVVSIHKNEK